MSYGQGNPGSAKFEGSTNGGMFAYDTEGQRAGNDLWYQIPRFYCELCGIFMDNNKPTKEHHFSGYRHRMNKEAKIREIQKKQKEKDEINDMKNETLKMIEIKAKEAYRKDCGLNPTTEGDIIATLSEWKEVQTEKGDMYYWNEKTDVTSWDKPPGWEKYRKAREKLERAKKLEKDRIEQMKRIASKQTSMKPADIARREAAAVGIGNDINEMKERALEAAIASHNRKRQAEAYLNPNGPTPTKIQPKSDKKPTESKSRLEVLQEQYAALKEKEENEKNGTTDELKFDGTYSGKEDLGLPQFEDTKTRRDKAYRDGLYSKAWAGRNDDAARAIGGQRKQLESFVIKSDTGMMKPAAFKSTKSKISWNKKKK